MQAQNRLVGDANEMVEEGPLKILSSIKAMRTLAKMVRVNLFYFIYFKIYLFLAALSLCCCALASSSCGVRASHCGGFSCCRAQALGTRASVVVACGLSSCGSRALEHKLSSCGARASVVVAHGLQ